MMCVFPACPPLGRAGLLEQDRLRGQGVDGGGKWRGVEGGGGGGGGGGIWRRQQQQAG